MEYKEYWTEEEIRQWLIDIMIIIEDNPEEAKSMLKFLINDLKLKKN
jgi:hypothetical protein